MTMENIMSEFLRRSRTAKGLSMADVQVVSGIDPSTLSKYENGLRDPTLKNYRMLCRIYGADASEPFRMDPQKYGEFGELLVDSPST